MAIIDHFHRVVHKRITEIMDGRKDALIAGTALKDSADTTAMQYAVAIGYLQAMNDCLTICHEAEVQINGGE